MVDGWGWERVFVSFFFSFFLFSGWTDPVRLVGVFLTCCGR